MKRRGSLWVFMLASVCGAYAHGSEQTVYRCTDALGVTTYSQTPCAEDAEPVAIESSSSGIGAWQVDPDALDDVNRQRRQERAERQIWRASNRTVQQKQQQIESLTEQRNALPYLPHTYAQKARLDNQIVRLQESIERTRRQASQDVKALRKRLKSEQARGDDDRSPI